MAETLRDHILYEVKDFVLARDVFKVTVRILKVISGNAPAPYTCHLLSSGSVIRSNEFLFNGETEEEVLGKMIAKLKTISDLEFSLFRS